MATKLTSSEVTANSEATAAQYNALRDDILKNAGDYVAAGGTVDAITLAIAAEFDAYAAGDVIKFKASGANTGAVTVNVNSLGAKNLFKPTSAGPAACGAGDLQTGAMIVAIYDGTQFVIVGGLPGASSSAPSEMRLAGLSGTVPYGWAINEDWSRLTFGFSSNANQVMKNPGGDKTCTFMTQAAGSAHTRGQGACVYVGSYCYKFGWGGATCDRFDDDDALSNEAAMSFSGTAPTACYGACTDGTFIYVHDYVAGGPNNYIRKYSISGTTLTLEATITLDDTSNDFQGGLAMNSDATFFYILTTLDEIIKFDASDGSTDTTHDLGSLSANNDIRWIGNDPDGDIRILYYLNNTADNISLIKVKAF